MNETELERRQRDPLDHHRNDLASRSLLDLQTRPRGWAIELQHAAATRVCSDPGGLLVITAGGDVTRYDWNGNQLWRRQAVATAPTVAAYDLPPWRPKLVVEIDNHREWQSEEEVRHPLADQWPSTVVVGQHVVCLAPAIACGAPARELWLDVVDLDTGQLTDRVRLRIPGEETLQMQGPLHLISLRDCAVVVVDPRRSGFANWVISFHLIFGKLSRDPAPAPSVLWQDQANSTLSVLNCADGSVSRQEVWLEAADGLEASEDQGANPRVDHASQGDFTLVSWCGCETLATWHDAVDSGSGTYLWSFPSRGGFDQRASVRFATSEWVLIRDDASYCRVDRATGRVVWRVESQNFFCFAVGDKMLLADRREPAHWYSTYDGRELASMDIPGGHIPVGLGPSGQIAWCDHDKLHVVPQPGV